MDRHSQVTMHSEHPNTGTLSRSEPTHRDDFPPSGHNRFDAFFFNRKFTDLRFIAHPPHHSTTRAGTSQLTSWYGLGRSKSDASRPLAGGTAPTLRSRSNLELSNN